MDDQTNAHERRGAGAEADVATLPRPASSKPRPEQPKLWNVILLDDDDHSYEYVIRMLTELFGKSPEAAYQMAKEVDASGRVICMTTHRELAELKQEQVHGYGKDRLIASCQGAMTSVIEPVM